jgi:hypothetical protein
VYQDTPIELFRVTSPWEPGAGYMTRDGASWTFAIRRKGEEEVPWKTAGGDIDTATDWGDGPGGVVCRAVLTRTARDPSFDVTALVRAWVSGKLPNHGLLLRKPAKGQAAHLVSSDAPEADRRPALTVRFSKP